MVAAQLPLAAAKQMFPSGLISLEQSRCVTWHAASVSETRELIGELMQRFGYGRVPVKFALAELEGGPVCIDLEEYPTP